MESISKTLKEWLLLATPSSDAQAVRDLFDPSQTFRVLPLTNIFRQGLGDHILRRCKIWNTLGQIWWEAELWDYQSYRFDRQIVPICRTDCADSILIDAQMSAQQQHFAEFLKERHHDRNAEFQLAQIRHHIHFAIERELTNLVDGGQVRPFRVSDDDLSLHAYSRRTGPEVYVEPRYLFETAFCRDRDAEVQDRRDILKESVSGQQGNLLYEIRRDTARGFELSERYSSHTLGPKEIQWLSKNVSADPSRGRAPERLTHAFLPLSTIHVLLEEESRWCFWLRQPAKKKADIATLSRQIHPSGDFARMKDYFRKDLSAKWDSSVSAAVKWDLLSLIYSAALVPENNDNISRKLLQHKNQTEMFRILYRGGLLAAIVIKNAWALGWMDREPVPTELVL